MTGGAPTATRAWEFIPVQVAGRVPVDVPGMTSRAEEALVAALARC